MQLKPYTRDTRITDFYPVPRSLLELNLPATAVLIYAVLLDRGTLSRKNGYLDEFGNLYVVYTREELADKLSISTKMVGNHIRCLENAGLIRKIRPSRKQANRYFLLLPDDCVTGTGTGTGSGRNVPSDGNFIGFRTGSNVPRSNRKEQQDISNLYQHEEGESL